MLVLVAIKSTVAQHRHIFLCAHMRIGKSLWDWIMENTWPCEVSHEQVAIPTARRVVSMNVPLIEWFCFEIEYSEHIFRTPLSSLYLSYWF